MFSLAFTKMWIFGEEIKARKQHMRHAILSWNIKQTKLFITLYIDESHILN